MIPTLGIDIAKAKFQVALRTAEGKLRQKSCPNTPAGFAELGAWLTRHGIDRVHACLEATGTFGEALAAWLYDAGHAVSVVNPAVIHAYARTHLLRTKTDALYFTVTTLATVGFGDVHPTGQVARAIVTAQIVFNLVFLGSLARLLTGQLQQRAARRRAEGAGGGGGGDGQPR